MKQKNKIWHKFGEVRIIKKYFRSHRATVHDRYMSAIEDFSYVKTNLKFEEFGCLCMQREIILFSKCKYLISPKWPRKIVKHSLKVMSRFSFNEGFCPDDLTPISHHGTGEPNHSHRLG